MAVKISVAASIASGGCGVHAGSRSAVMGSDAISNRPD
jgi:hypothetical protein